MAAKLIINLKKKNSKISILFLVKPKVTGNERFTFASSSVIDGTIIVGVYLKLQ